MIPMQMAQDLAREHALDLRRMGRAGRPLRTRAASRDWRDRWDWRDGWRFRTDWWRRRRWIGVKPHKRLAAITEAGWCPD